MPNTDSFMQQMGQAAGGGIIGIGMQGLGNQLQLKQQKKLMEAQAGQQKGLMDYQNMKQMEMWRNTSYGPQVEQMKMAGINPALLYGMSGGGGQSSGGGMPNTGGGTAEGAHNIIGMGMSAAQMGLLKAQRENIEADTANKKADIPVKAETGKNIAADTTGKGLYNQWLSESMKDRLDLIATEALNKIEELNQNITKTGLDRATVLQKAEQIKQAAIGEGIKNALMSKQIEVSDAEISKWATELEQKWKELDIRQQEATIKTILGNYEIEHPGVWKIIGNVMQRAQKFLETSPIQKQIDKHKPQ